MFVSGNTLTDVRKYFQERLSERFSESEIKFMLKSLVAHRMRVEDVSFIGNGDMKFSESDLLYFHSCQKRLNADEPFQYILGSTWFGDLNLLIDKRALIPRPETEELVMWVVDSLKDMSSPSVLDVCAGSGCIALAVKDKLPASKVKAMELSNDAISLVRENIIHTKIQIDPILGDALDDKSYQGLSLDSFDCWVSNPPYIPNRDKKLMHENVLKNEPHMALFVEDTDPLIFYREISLIAQKHLKSGGFLFFEIHEDLGSDVVNLMQEIGFVNIELRKDLQGKDRMVRATK